MIVLLTRPDSYWVCHHITDEIVSTNGGRLNLDLATRVHRAKMSAEHSVPSSTTVVQPGNAA